MINNVILIIDDNQDNLNVIIEYLRDTGYETVTARNGKMGIRRAKFSQPDLILLDVMMPEMDGFETCSYLKQDEQTKEIPVIFMTALDDIENKVRGFDVGGVDYITKPVAEKEVLARVKTHLTLRQLQKNLELKVAERTAELLQADELLRHSEKKYRAIFEDSKDMIFITRLDGQIEDVSPACQTLLDYTRQEALQLNAVDIYANPADRSRFRELMEQQGGVKELELKFRRRDGKEIDVLMTATLRQADNGEVLGYQGIVRDITLQKQSEREQIKLLAIQHELAIAHDMQENLLPKPEPDWPDIEVICFSRSAKHIGGDFYQYHALESANKQTLTRYVIAVGDVSGKGISAALLMAVSLAQFDASLLQPLSPAERLAYLDTVLMPYTKMRRQNCAMCYVEVAQDRAAQLARLTVVNAGCIPPYIRRRNGVIEFDEQIGGFALGQGHGAMIGYEQHTVELSPGDIIILTSDGVVEANNEAEEMLGFERLEQIVRDFPSNEPSSAKSMLEYLKQAVFAFTGTAEQHDDMTMVVVKV